MATASVPRAPVTAPPMMQQPPVFNQVPQPMPDDEPDEQEPPPNAVPSMNPRGPVFNSFPQPQVVNPQVSTPTTVPGTVDPNDPQDTAMPSTPGVFPGAVSVPGTIAPPPPQPGQTNDRR